MSNEQMHATSGSWWSALPTIDFRAGTPACLSRPDFAVTHTAAHAAAAEMPTHAFGPFVVYGNLDRATQLWTGSVMVVLSHEYSPRPPHMHFKVIGDRSSERSIPAVLLSSFKGYHFWRFNLTARLAAAPQTMQYSVRASSQNPLWGRTDTYAVHLPAAGETWHWGLHASSATEDCTEEAHMWRDVLSHHRTSPLHVLVGAGGLVDGSGVWQLPGLQQWLALSRQERLEMKYSGELDSQVCEFYFRQYCTQLAHPTVAYVLATVPQVHTCSDVDVWQGWGGVSTTKEVQACPVLRGVANAARRFAFLFQQHATPDTCQALNGTLGPVGTASQLKTMGPSQALLLPDMCWERDCNQLLSSDVLSLLQRKAACLPSVGLRHLIVVTPQPVIGPGASPAEVLRPDSIAEQASSHGVGTKDGSQCSSAAPVGPMDGWMVSAQRLQQRVQLIQTLQHLAGTRRLRVSLLSGSGAARACWVGKLHRQPKEGLKEDACFMQQVVVGPLGQQAADALQVAAMETSFHACNMCSDTHERLVARFGVGQCIKGTRSWLWIREAPFRISAGPALNNGALLVDIRMEHPFHKECRPDVLTVETPMLHQMPAQAHDALQSDAAELANRQQAQHQRTTHPASSAVGSGLYSLLPYSTPTAPAKAYMPIASGTVSGVGRRTVSMPGALAAVMLPQGGRSNAGGPMMPAGRPHDG